MLRIEVNQSGSLAGLLQQVTRRIEDQARPLEEAGDLIVDSIRKRMERGGDPAFAPLKASTLRKKGQNPVPLAGSGALRRSLFWSVQDGKLVVGSHSPYAAIHQFGGRTGRNHKSRIPARPFLTITRADRSAVAALIGDHLLSQPF